MISGQTSELTIRGSPNNRRTEGDNSKVTKHELHMWDMDSDLPFLHLLPCLFWRRRQRGLNGNVIDAVLPILALQPGGPPPRSPRPRLLDVFFLLGLGTLQRAPVSQDSTYVYSMYNLYQRYFLMTTRLYNIQNHLFPRCLVPNENNIDAIQVFDT